MANDGQFRFISPGGEQVAEAFRKINRQPNWVLRTAVLVFLLLVAIPILALVLLATVAATAVFAILAIWNSFLKLLKGGKRQEQRRKNVRVIDRN